MEPILLQNVAFTDTAGASFVAATLQLATAQYSENTNENFDFNIANSGATETNTNSYTNITCQFYYWISEETRLTWMDDTNPVKRTPYFIVDKESMTTSFNFQPTDDVYDGLTLEQKCMHYLENVILPSLV
jgi:hypothetical protein